MWSSFQGALEKRVRNTTKKIKPDKYIILKVAKKVLYSSFGEAGKDNIEIVSCENGILKLKSDKSIWRSELVVKKGFLIHQINAQLSHEEIKSIIVIS